MICGKYTKMKVKKVNEFSMAIKFRKHLRTNGAESQVTSWLMSQLKFRFCFVCVFQLPVFTEQIYSWSLCVSLVCYFIEWKGFLQHTKQTQPVTFLCLCVTHRWESDDRSLKAPSGMSDMSLPWRDLRQSEWNAMRDLKKKIKNI